MARPTASPSPSSTTRIPYLHALSMCGPLFYDGVFAHAISLAMPANSWVRLSSDSHLPPPPGYFFLVAAEDDDQQHGSPHEADAACLCTAGVSFILDVDATSRRRAYTPSHTHVSIAVNSLIEPITRRFCRRLPSPRSSTSSSVCDHRDFDRVQLAYPSSVASSTFPRPQSFIEQERTRRRRFHIAAWRAVYR
ncbi:hypothetical protein EXIGLDRAFT_759961 [Exidia glandulosa HHB12029]|uniref:Uncharacterized protein n=1 Tax=Exidia glandulosa HHB12029 TaxID=1314781 RepID=A0A165PPC1_EXIGL|nr:hypothetical protein EXIGLDRAFT_759961 [Exidia glandulosa HHB12029]